MNIIFAGTPNFAVPALQILQDLGHKICAVYTKPDSPSGRGQKLTASPIKKLALSFGLPVLQPKTLQTQAELQLLHSFNADIMVVVAYGLILSQAVLGTPKLGCLNIHASLLPRWRGAAPIQCALITGDKKTGITVMQIIKKLDAGDILHQEECVIESHYTSVDLHDKLAVLGALGLQKVLAKIKQGTLHAQKQDESLVTYAKKITKQEALINWQLSAEELSRKIRGFSGWPVAYTLFQGKVLRIWKARLVSNYIGNKLPGETSIHNKYLRVATGSGALDLLEVQLPGRKCIKIQDFLNTYAGKVIRLG